MDKTFVGIGFGPIQSGLFLLEAIESAHFERLVVAEVVPEIVAAVRNSGGRVRVNVANRSGIQTHQIDSLEIYNPLNPRDASLLVDAIAVADEIATALPSVDSYRLGCPSPADLLGRGLSRKLTDDSLPRAVIYAAENDNHAAQKLRDAVFATIDAVDPARVDERIQFLNTVIGKMSGVVTDPAQIQRDGLAPLDEGGSYAILVEQFNRILISRITLPDFRRGIEVFLEKPDLLPFEEAKLYGHNTAHALLGYIANRAELKLMHEVDAVMRQFVERAFNVECGGALCRCHAGIDPLFTSAGWTQYVQDLLTRMTNPFLMDRVDRVIRDPRRKLGWDDRFIGAMRLAIAHGIDPTRIAYGAALVVDILMREQINVSTLSVLDSIWGDLPDLDDNRSSVVKYIEQAQVESRSQVLAWS